MRRTRREHVNNLALVILNLFILALAAFLLEYETSRAANPGGAWVPTPSEIVFPTAVALSLGSILVLAILALIYKKDLRNRRYLWWITGFDMIIGLAIVALLTRSIGTWSLLHFVLFP